MHWEEIWQLLELGLNIKISPDGITFNQIDHTLIDIRHGSNIMDVRSMRAVDIVSDHYLVNVKIRLKIKKAVKLRRTEIRK